VARAVDQPPDVAEVARTAPRRSAGAVAGVRGGAVVNGGFSPGQGSHPDVGRGRTRITGAVLASREPAHLSLGRSASNGADRAPWRPAGRAPRAVGGGVCHSRLTACLPIQHRGPRVVYPDAPVIAARNPTLPSSVTRRLGGSGPVAVVTVLIILRPGAAASVQ